MGMFLTLPPAEKIVTAAEAKLAVAYLKPKKILAFDTETTGLSTTRDRAILLSLSDGKRRFAIWPSAIPYFTDILENPDTELIAHNAKFDMWMLLNVGIDVNRHSARKRYRVYDIMIMHTLLDDGCDHDLKYQTKTFLGIDHQAFKTTFNLKGNKKRPLEEVLLDPENEDKAANYSSLDAYVTYKIFFILRKYLKETEIEQGGFTSMWEYYCKLELKFTRILWEMERSGIKVDQAKLLELAPPLEAKMLEIQKWFGRRLGRMWVNLNSMPQKQDIFFNVLKRKPVSFTEEGQPSIDEDALKHWYAQYKCEYSEKLLEYSDANKQLGTYVINLLTRIHTDGRLHTNFKQAGARTGRLSSADPNLQNQAPFIRVAYVPEKGYKLFAVDYEQLEMRILAHMSRDPTLCDAILRGLDVHVQTAATMFKVSYDDIKKAKKRGDVVDAAIAENEKRAKMKPPLPPLPYEPLTKEEATLIKYRKAAKTINFGLMYGQGAGKLASELACSLDEAKAHIRKYFKTFPKVLEYFAKAIEEANKKGYCVTILGRRRQVPGLQSIYSSDIAEAERKVKNSPIQGTASDIAKCAMIKLYEDPLITASGTRMLLQVHDEVDSEVPEQFEKDEAFNKQFKHCMEHPLPFDLAVPLDVSDKYGANWLQTK